VPMTPDEMIASLLERLRVLGEQNCNQMESAPPDLRQHLKMACFAIKDIFTMCEHLKHPCAEQRAATITGRLAGLFYILLDGPERPPVDWELAAQLHQIYLAAKPIAPPVPGSARSRP
jgi:hypothetical protein